MGGPTPIVVTANGLMAKSLDEYLSRVSLGEWIKGLIQKVVLLDTARIVGGSCLPWSRDLFKRDTAYPGNLGIEGAYKVFSQ